MNPPDAGKSYLALVCLHCSFFLLLFLASAFAPRPFLGTSAHIVHRRRLQAREVELFKFGARALENSAHSRTFLARAIEELVQLGREILSVGAAGGTNGLDA